MENVKDKKKPDIKGWGVDLNPYNEPTYPIKNYTGDDHKRLDYEKPTQQKSNVEILQSNERPSLSSVFGTSTPPSGLSGIIRRWAYKHSESSYRHWLPLLLADRVNVVEGYIGDILHGHVPNVFAERGWKADWKYNRKGLFKNVAIITGVTAGIVMLATRKKKKRRFFN